MYTSSSRPYNYGPAANPTPDLCQLRGFRTRPYFWTPHTTDAMALRDEKFKAYSYRAPRDPAPQFETRYMDHFTTSSRPPKYPSAVQSPVGQQPLPQYQPKTLEGDLMKWFIVFALLMLALWLLGFTWPWPVFESTVPLVMIGMALAAPVLGMWQWLETPEDVELY